MPKIYIFHKLLQQGILQCYGLITHSFGQFKLTHYSQIWRYAHSRWQNNLRTFTMEGSMVLREKVIPLISDSLIPKQTTI